MYNNTAQQSGGDHESTKGRKHENAMKTRESGMPDEAMWEGFFDPPAVLRMLQLSGCCRDIVDFGCGYGTFTIPAARIVAGVVYALDIEPEMIAATQAKAAAAGLGNVHTVLRDFVAEGTGLPSACVDYAMLLNILHAECPESVAARGVSRAHAGRQVGDRALEL